MGESEFIRSQSEEVYRKDGLGEFQRARTLEPLGAFRTGKLARQADSTDAPHKFGAQTQNYKKNRGQKVYDDFVSVSNRPVNDDLMDVITTQGLREIKVPLQMNSRKIHSDDFVPASSYAERQRPSSPPVDPGQISKNQMDGHVSSDLIPGTDEIGRKRVEVNGKFNHNLNGNGPDQVQRQINGTYKNTVSPIVSTDTQPMTDGLEASYANKNGLDPELDLTLEPTQVDTCSPAIQQSDGPGPSIRNLEQRRLKRVVPVTSPALPSDGADPNSPKPNTKIDFQDLTTLQPTKTNISVHKGDETLPIQSTKSEKLKTYSARSTNTRSARKVKSQTTTARPRVSGPSKSSSTGTRSRQVSRPKTYAESPVKDKITSSSGSEAVASATPSSPHPSSTRKRKHQSSPTHNTIDAPTPVNHNRKISQSPLPRVYTLTRPRYVLAQYKKAWYPARIIEADLHSSPMVFTVQWLVDLQITPVLAQEIRHLAFHKDDAVKCGTSAGGVSTRIPMTITHDLACAEFEQDRGCQARTKDKDNRTYRIRANDLVVRHEDVIAQWSNRLVDISDLVAEFDLLSKVRNSAPSQVTDHRAKDEKPPSEHPIPSPHKKQRSLSVPDPVPFPAPSDRMPAPDSRASSREVNRFPGHHRGLSTYSNIATQTIHNTYQAQSTFNSPGRSGKRRISHLFMGYAFLTTSLDNKVHQRLIERLSDHSGTIVETFQSIWELEIVSDQADDSLEGEFSVNHNYTDLRGIFLLTGSASRTSKYYTALALGVPCIHLSWINDSVTENTLRDWRSYLLPVPESLHVKTMLSQVVDPSYAVDIGWTQQRFIDSQWRRPLLGCKALLLSRSGSVQDFDTYTYLLFAMGIDRLRLIRTPNDVPEIERDDYDYIITDDDNTWKLTWGRIVNFQWLKECIIMGRALAPKVYSVKG